jgi:peroxiredoxin
MARTESTMIELGRQAPHFSLKDVRDGRVVSSDAAMGPRGLLTMFICAHCPFVKHIERELARLGNDYRESGVGIVAISSNDATKYPDDSPSALAEQALALGFAFPYLYDETQDVARAYDAACTPDFFLFDREGKLVYRGQFDGSRPGSEIPVTGEDLRGALDALIAGKAIAEEQRPSLGCNIKWKDRL